MQYRVLLPAPTDAAVVSKRRLVEEVLPIDLLLLLEVQEHRAHVDTAARLGAAPDKGLPPEWVGVARRARRRYSGRRNRAEKPRQRKALARASPPPLSREKEPVGQPLAVVTGKGRSEDLEELESLLRHWAQFRRDDGDENCPATLSDSDSFTAKIAPVMV